MAPHATRTETSPAVSAIKALAMGSREAGKPQVQSNRDTQRADTTELRGGPKNAKDGIPMLAQLEQASPAENYTPMETLDAMIEAGWGEVPQCKIPPSWRSLRPPREIHSQTLEERQAAMKRRICAKRKKQVREQFRRNVSGKWREKGGWTNGKIIDRIERFIIEHGRAPESPDFARDKSLPAKTTVRTHFGRISMANAEAQARLNGWRPAA